MAFFASYIAIAFMNNNLHTIFKSLNEVKVWSTTAFASSHCDVRSVIVQTGSFLPFSSKSKEQQSKFLDIFKLHFIAHFFSIFSPLCSFQKVNFIVCHLNCMEAAPSNLIAHTLERRIFLWKFSARNCANWCLATPPDLVQHIIILLGRFPGHPTRDRKGFRIAVIQKRRTLIVTSSLLDNDYPYNPNLIGLSYISSI